MNCYSSISKKYSQICREDVCFLVCCGTRVGATYLGEQSCADIPWCAHHLLVDRSHCWGASVYCLHCLIARMKETWWSWRYDIVAQESWVHKGDLECCGHLGGLECYHCFVRGCHCCCKLIGQECYRQLKRGQDNGDHFGKAWGCFVSLDLIRELAS